MSSVNYGLVMSQLVKDSKALSAALTTVLFVTIMLTAAVLLYTFVNTNMDSLLDSSSENPFNLFIGNVKFNETCITIHVINGGERDAVIERVYINKELRAFNLIDHDLKISANSSKEIYVFGSYNAGCRFDIKIVFESGHTLSTMERY